MITLYLTSRAQIYIRGFIKKKAQQLSAELMVDGAPDLTDFLYREIENRIYPLFRASHLGQIPFKRYWDLVNYINDQLFSLGSTVYGLYAADLQFPPPPGIPVLSHRQGHVRIRKVLRPNFKSIYTQRKIS